jgi:hypothetical protein
MFLVSLFLASFFPFFFVALLIDSRQVLTSFVGLLLLTGTGMGTPLPT